MVWAGLRIAILSSAVAILFGLWLAWLLATHEFSGKRAVRAVIGFALVLPAPIVCYYLLFSPAHLWSWGMVAAGTLSALPLVTRTARAAFSSVNPVYRRAAQTLGASEWRLFWRVELPLAFHPVLAGAGLAFARVAAELAVLTLVASRLTR